MTEDEFDDVFRRIREDGLKYGDSFDSVGMRLCLFVHVMYTRLRVYACTDCINFSFSHLRLQPEG